MSGVVKSVKKVFRAITKSPIGKMVVAAGIAYFTAGLGSTLLGGLGVGSTAASGAFTIAGSETLGTVLSNALSGSVAGGAMAGLTGESIGKGLGFGALGGAVMGGVRSALGDFTMGPDAIRGGEGSDLVEGGSPGDDNLASQATGGVQQVGPATDQGAIYNSNVPPTPADPGATGAQPGVAANPAQNTASTAPATPDTPAKTGILGNIGNWIERNPTAAVAGGGALVSGLGQGLLAKATADGSEEAAAAKIKAEQEKQAAIYASHSGGVGGLLTQGIPAGQPQRPTPTEKFDPRTYEGQYVYDPGVGRIVFVPNQQRMA